jgi:hypothetical protein
MSYARPTFRRRRMRLKRRLIVVVRLITASYKCNPGASIQQGDDLKKLAGKVRCLINWSKYASPRIADN